MLLDLLLSIVSPHLCKGCGVVGSGLCECCKNDITSEKWGNCLLCNGFSTTSNLCRNCRKNRLFADIFVVGESSGALKNLVYDFKFNSERGHARVLAELLDETLPILPNEVVVVPIPTIPKHIRQRGFGHTELVAKKLASLRGLKYAQNILIRADNSVQHGLKAKQRFMAAAKTFKIHRTKNLPEKILLVDDVYTTGATVKAAAKLLKAAGIKTIYLAIIARHNNK
ncbi:MAG: hypothetical protein LBL08_00220 [Candidatus Nomurabacteria bacterium]|jgi:ComF family protein|nr:hypothetical protein [Candidatus Nomurabacteria bacterium]